MKRRRKGREEGAKVGKEDVFYAERTWCDETSTTRLRMWSTE